MINILLLGGSGFIGKNVVEYYNNNENINLEYPGSKELDLLDEKKVSERLKSKFYDVVLNFALYIDLIDKTKDASKVLEYNLRMYYNLAKCNHLYGRMFYLGSGAEYNKEYSIVNVKEEEIGENIPVDQYGLMKYIIGRDVENSNNIYNLRLFGIFGKYENYSQRFISNTICKILFNLPITINQNVIFDYLYIDDFLFILNKLINSTNLQYHTYNVCAGNKISLIEICDALFDIIGTKQKIVIKKDGFQNEYTGCNSRLLNEFPDITITDYKIAFDRLYNWYKSNITNIDIKKL